MLIARFNCHNINIRCGHAIIRALLLTALLFGDKSTFATSSYTNQTHTVRHGSQTQAEDPIRVAPPMPNDSTFVAMSGGELDQFTYGGEIAVGIPIDRVFSTKPVPEAVKAGILPPTIELSLSFYANEPPWCPPLHRISVNGHQLPLILPRADGHWRRFSIAIPTLFLDRLPTVPGVDNRPTPETQHVQIETDGAGCQCGLEIDWVALTIVAPRPVVLVPGWSGTALSWSPFVELLNEDGMPRVIASLGNGMQSIPTSGSMLGSAIQTARTNFGVDKVNLVAHSKGGLTSRWALDNGSAPYVEHLISLGSPHHGIDAARLLIAKLNTCVIRGNSDPLVPDECQISADEVSLGHIRDMNYTDCKLEAGISGLPIFTGCIRIANPQPDVTYRSIVGSTDAFVDNASSTYPWNANAAPYPSQATIDLSLPGRGHYTLKEGRTELDCTMAFIHPTRYRCPDAGTLQAISEQVTTDPAQTIWISSVITNAMSLTLPIPIDTSTNASFIIESASSLNFSLRSPTGQTINGNANPSVTYQAGFGFGNDPSNWLYEYTVQSPQPGVWQIQVSNPLTTAMPLKFVIATISNSITRLQLRTDKQIYVAGETVVLEASLENTGTAVIETNLHVDGWLPGSVPFPLAFADDGANGDRFAGDGIYSAKFTAPVLSAGSSPYLSLQITANSAKLTRLSIAEIAIRPSTARLALTQPMTVSTMDANYNQQFETITLWPSIYVSQTGHFRLAGKLIDADGYEVATASASSHPSSEPLNIGYHTLALTFSGKQIRQHGQHGQYRLSDVKLFDESSSSFLIDSATAVLAVSGYQSTNFEGDGPHILNIDHTTIDTDGNERYNQIVMTITLTDTNTGDYRFGGQLKDINGASVSWTQGHAVLSEGMTEITLVFSGASIVENLSDGPYQLSDLTLQQYTGAGHSGYGTTLHPNYSIAAYHYTDFDSERPTDVFLVDTSKRQSVADFYRTEFITNSVDLNWSGNFDTCAPGQTAPEFKAALLRRINYYRAMAGLPTVTLSDTLSDKAQATALMMARNNTLSHSPGTDWLCYTDVGAATAQRSNLYYSTGGRPLVDAIDAYMAEPYVPSNGHRRQLLYPPTQAMGTGDVPVAETQAHFNTLYVQDLSILSLPRPNIRDGFVAWPPAGYVPYDVVYPYWSFAIAGADFLSATVQMLKDGQPNTLTQQTVTTRQADNAIVWVPEGLNPDDRSFRWPQPAAGHEPVYTIIIDGVLLNGVSRSFSYTVTVIDPAVTPIQPTPTPTTTATSSTLRHYSFLPILIGQTQP